MIKKLKINQIIKGAIILLSIVIFSTFFSCKKFLEVPTSVGQLSTEQIFSDSLLTDNSMKSIYIKLVSVADPGYRQTLALGLAADELNMASPSGDYQQFLTNSLTNSNGRISAFWNDYYNIVYSVNLNLENLESHKPINTALWNRYIGEAHFLRAFIYFQMVNMFGDVPLVLKSDYSASMNMPRTPVSQIYDQILEDLNQANNLLAVQYDGATTIRANKLISQALLAQVYLYQQNWQKAEETSNLVLQSGKFKLVKVDQIFLKNNQEAIFQLMQYSTGDSQKNLEASTFVPKNATTIPTYPLQKSLVDAFDNTDARKAAWIKSNVINRVTYYYPYKYTAILATGNARDEYTTLFRLGEQYLIRAESAAQLGHNDLAISSIDSIRKRAALPLWKTVSPISSTTDLLNEVYKERRLELMVERGHRWDDLKRLNQANTVLGSIKTGWESTDVLFPIPITQLTNNPFLKQNPGY